MKEEWGTDTHAMPFIKDLDSDEITFKRESQWWSRWVDYCECAKRKCSGRLVLGSSLVGYGTVDTLAAIRGAPELMIDFHENPEGVHNALRRTEAAFNEMVATHRNLFKEDFAKYGCANHHGFYSEGLLGIPQCDFGFNIDKEHFDEFALPYIKREIEGLDSVEYHLDGVGNITHLESICSIGRVGVIQWVPGAGNEHKEWGELFKRIHSFGKGLLLWADSPDDAKRLWESYPGISRMILHVKASSRKEMDAYLKAFDS